jgi:hypothetical protein
MHFLPFFLCSSTIFGINEDGSRYDDKTNRKLSADNDGKPHGIVKTLKFIRLGTLIRFVFPALIDIDKSRLEYSIITNA